MGRGGEWTVAMTWSELDRNGPSRLEIRATDPDNPPAGGISQTVLRRINIAAAVEDLRESEAGAEGRQVSEADLWTDDLIIAGSELDELSADGLTDLYLAKLAQLYVRVAVAPKPLERLAELSGKTPSAIKSHLWHATNRGFLERSPGRAGGKLTEEAWSILAPLAGADLGRDLA